VPSTPSAPCPEAIRPRIGTGGTSVMDFRPAQMPLAKWWALRTYPELRYRRWAANR
jgi:hypothetical protein